MSKDEFNLNTILADPRYKLNLEPTETPEEITARLKRAQDDADQQKRVFWALFGLLVVCAAITLIIALVSAEQETREWARMIFAAIVTGAIGFLGGNATRSSLR